MDTFNGCQLPKKAISDAIPSLLACIIFCNVNIMNLNGEL